MDAIGYGCLVVVLLLLVSDVAGRWRSARDERARVEADRRERCARRGR